MKVGPPLAEGDCHRDLSGLVGWFSQHMIELTILSPSLSGEGESGREKGDQDRTKNSEVCG
jgi:hypothetical protein